MEQKKENYSLLSWDTVEEKEDAFISFLLYKEGKSIELISKIRNLTKETIENHIIHCKSILNSIKIKIDYDFFINLLASTKEERGKILGLLSKDEKSELVTYLIKEIPLIENAEDKMIALWIAGELKDNRLLPVIHKEINHKHGNVRRMVCSALGKINSTDSVDILHRALQDAKPQVRQYASKALKTIGNKKTIGRLKALLNNPKELTYVRRSYLETIESIEKRLRRG